MLNILLIVLRNERDGIEHMSFSTLYAKLKKNIKNIKKKNL